MKEMILILNAKKYDFLDQKSNRQVRGMSVHGLLGEDLTPQQEGDRSEAVYLI